MIYQFYLLFEDETEIVGSSMQWDDIHADLFAVDAWDGRNEMLINASKSQLQHIGRLPPSLLLTLDDNGTHIPLPVVSSTKNLEIVIDCSLKPPIQIDAAVAKAISALFFISRTFERLNPASSSQSTLHW